MTYSKCDPARNNAHHKLNTIYLYTLFENYIKTYVFNIKYILLWIVDGVYEELEEHKHKDKDDEDDEDNESKNKKPYQN